MKRLLIIMASMAVVFGDTPEGQWKLSGLRVDYFDIAREDAALVAVDSYGFGISVPLAAIPYGALFNTTINGPFTNQTLGQAGVNLNVNLYGDGSGAIGEGSYYPDVDIGTNPDGSLDCITTGKIFPITDQFFWTESDSDVPFPATNILGLPSANAAAGENAEGLGVNGSEVFDNWPDTPANLPVPDVLDYIITGFNADGSPIVVYGPAVACYGTDGTDGAAAAYFGGDMALCMGSGNVGNLPGQWGGMYKMGTFDSQMGQDLTTKFLLEWNAIDGEESASGLGDEIGIDEDGDGTDFDRIFGVPYISSTVINQANPLCDITGGTLTGQGAGLAYPVAGDIVAELGGADAVAQLVTGSCMAGVVGGAYDSCIGQVYDGVYGQCEAAGGPDYAVAGLCTEASQGPEFAGACEAYGAETAVYMTCLGLGFSDEQCAEGGVLAAQGVAGYCSDLGVANGLPEGMSCADLGTSDCAVLTNLEFATFLCSGLAATLVESETCTEWVDSFYGEDGDDSFFDQSATQVLGVTCSDFSAGLAAGFAAGDPTTLATIDGLFAQATAGLAGPDGMTCSAYGASYVPMCVEGVSGKNTFYIMNPDLTTWGMFVTYKAAVTQQYLGEGYSLEEIAGFAPYLFENDSGYDFDPACYANGQETCGGRLVMNFAPTCVAEVEAHQIVAEFIDLEALACEATGDVAGGFDDRACQYNAQSAFGTCEPGPYGMDPCPTQDGYGYDSCDCDDDNGNGTLDPEEICFGDGYWDTEYEGPDGDGLVNVIDVVKMVAHITDPMAQLGGMLFCQGDLVADGVINVLDVVNVVGIITSSRVGGASSTTIEYSEDAINLTSNGYIGGIDMLVEFADESFNFELGDHFVADYVISGNTARIVMIGDENSLEEILTVTEGEIVSISNVLVANSSDEVTDVTVVFDSNQPSAYIIKDAYPNPFNPATTISVELNTTADISVKVYNITGQLVDVIAQGNFSPNTYNWTWNAENLASGVYFIATQIGNDMNNQKVMLIK